ncbi:hypothetical protein W97_06277 [Coniosporium apollinis CBS 100218]|uniref:Exocyst complex component Sec3 PIP2-binding N-terminal domain-containing protein n=1 Tax=Coniosporium apollinis (strain CBS 100218) TaxID=1168221 RepID=R7YY52_CONA1|nr:uncharacterized protein W97_06277 [Coniosporium apollinis CBS 100218]EON66875.1 hypothetical protein W97_06277 [Coniosporium apollinis CBS 100218]
MSANNGMPPRPPQQPNGAAMRRAGQDPRNVSGAQSPGSQASTVTSPQSLSRAAVYEDAKRRIVESLFSKIDEQGDLAESYITHLRVEEDAAYPQSPPPPDSPPSNKKPRVIILAVKKTGRVRLHKARENANGSFSIGKTWNIDDLTAIESFTNATPQNAEEQQRKDWAGSVGFVVTITKQYYWQATTSTEKEYFIASLLKVYRKYTSGRVPQLSGFSNQELEKMQELFAQGPHRSGGPSPAPSNQSRPSTGPGQGPPRPAQTGRPGQGPPSAYRGPSGPLRPRPSQDRDLRKPPSREQLRPSHSPNPASSIASSQRLTPQSSHSEMAPPRSITPDDSSISSKTPSVPSQQSPRHQYPFQMSSEDTSHTDIPRVDGASISSSTMHMWKPSGLSPEARREPSPKAFPLAESISSRPPTSQSTAGSTSTQNDHFRNEPPKPMPPPERKRPPLLDPNGSQRSFDSGFVSRDPSAPYSSPLTIRGSKEALSDRPSNDSAQDLTTRMPGGFFPSSTSLDVIEPPPAVSPPIRPPSPKPEDEARPGLGPMVKQKANKNVADVIRKAATAYGAFKPRAGGAGDRLRAAKETPASNEPDGITGVVPAPGLVRSMTDDSMKGPPTEQEKSIEPPAATDEVPEVKVTSPVSPSPAPDKPIDDGTAPTLTRSPSPRIAKQKADSPESRRQRRRSNSQIKSLANLGVDSALLDGRGLEFESILSDFGWGSSVLQARKLDVMEADLRRELGRVEAGSWLDHLDRKDDRVDAVDKMLDRAIAECDELEGLLTLYGVELSSLNDDIAFIEAQSQGLQVQTANQKLLQTELQTLVDTISISPGQLEALRRAPIGKTDGLEAIESSLLLLYKAMITIDPKIRQANRSSTSLDHSIGSSELSAMRALQEKRDRYLSESALFLSRLEQFMDMTFGAAFMNTKDALSQSDPLKSPTKLEVGVHDLARNTLWQYSPVILFAKEIDLLSWEALIRMYQSRARALYQEELRENISAWQKTVRKPTGEEQELLFTSQEKDTESLSTTARKLTVKRSQTLARSLRSASNEKEATRDKKQDGRLHPFEVYSGILDSAIPLIFTEQNFIVDFFHATSSSSLDFAEAVTSTPIPARRGTNLYARKLFEADRAMAKRVLDVMDDLYSFWSGDLSSLIEWAIKADPLQGVGILAALERHLGKLEETNQDFLARTLQGLHTRLGGLFARFVDEQIRAIEDTKVKIKKRKGVIAFIRTFPHFSATIENMLAAASAAGSTPIQTSADYDDPKPGTLDVRQAVDAAYTRINKAMFESLKVIAKESPAVMAGVAQGVHDPEDKEALNYHILLIENMNHYVEEVDERDDAVLAEWRARAKMEMGEHMALYVDAVVRRPLGKLLAFLETTDHLLRALGPSTPPASLTSRSTHTRPTFRKLLAAHDSKEIRRGIDALRKRIDKHFGDADDPGLSRNLVAKVVKECEEFYVEVVRRVGRVGEAVYGDGTEGDGGKGGEVRLEWGEGDVRGWFRR